MKFLAAIAAFFLTMGATASLRAAGADSWKQRIEQAFQAGQLEEAARLAEIAVENPDTAGAAHEWLGRISMARARYQEAVLHFQSAQENGKDLPSMAEAWSKALLKLGRSEQACAVLKDAVRETEESNLLYLAGTCYLRLGASQQAAPHLEAAYRNGLRHTGVAMHLAQAQLNSGREDQAVELLTSLTESSSSPSLLLEIGKMLFQKVLYRQSIQAFRKAWHQKPGWYDAGMYLALAHYLLGEYPRSAEVLTAMNSEPGRVEYHYLRGSVYARLEDHQNARQELEKSIGMAPERAGGYLNLGLYYLEEGNREKAIELIEKGAAKALAGAKVFYRVASRENCNGLSPPAAVEEGDRRRAQLFIALADSLLAGQQWGSALEVYLTALQIDPRAARPYGGIGLICQELGTALVGLDYLKKGIELHPDNAQLHYYLGSLYEYLSRPEQAIESYRTALRLQGTKQSPGRYWLRLGLAQLAADRRLTAETSFRTALRRDPDSAEAHYQLGKLYLRSHRFSEAEKLLERAVQLDPSLIEAYYSWGFACIRNGKPDKGSEILESYEKKKSMRQAQLHGPGVMDETPGLPKMRP